MRIRTLALAGAAILAATPASALSAWGKAVRLSPPGAAEYRSPQVALNARGDAAVAWVRVGGGQARVQVADRAGTRGRWRSARTLSGPGAGLARVAVDSRGRAAVAWTKGRLIASATRSGPAGTWRLRPVAAAAGPVGDLVLGLDPAGAPTVVWSERRGRGHRVRVAAADALGSPWSVRSARIDVPGTPALALSPGRSTMVAWVEKDRVRAARTASGAFERPVSLSDVDAGSPGLDATAGGAALAAWAVRLPGGSSVVVGGERGRSSGRWRITDDLGIGGAPAVALNDRGDAVVAWGVDEHGSLRGIDAVTRRAAGDWESSSVVPRVDCNCALSVVAAAIDDSGTATVSWRRRTGSREVAGAASLTPGADSWAKASLQTGGSGVGPELAAAGNGLALAVWPVAGRGAGVVVLPGTRGAR